MAIRTVAAGAFKQGCLALLDQVAAGSVEIVVTKRGKPVARLVPMESADDRENAILTRLRSAAPAVVACEDDLLRPTGRLAGWRAR